MYISDDKIKENISKENNPFTSPHTKGWQITAVVFLLQVNYICILIFYDKEQLS